MDVEGLVEYLQELRENNNKAWFEANRDRYDILRGQFKDMVQDVIGRVAKFDSSVADLDAAKCLFRINRDIRFSKDKSPYKVAFSAMLSPGSKTDSHGGYYIMIDADDDLLVGAGLHEPSPEVLLHLRKSIVERGKKLQDVIDTPAFKAKFPEIGGEKLKTAPRDFPVDHLYIELIKHKSLYAGNTTQATSHDPKNIAAEIEDIFKTAYPFVKILREFLA